MNSKHIYSIEGHYFKKAHLRVKRDKCPEPTVLNQSIDGFGGAITNSSLHVYSQMNSSQKKKFLKLVYGDKGLDYSWARIPIGTCDFSYDMYDYASDEELSDFTIHPYEDSLISFIEHVNKKYTHLNLVGAVWSPLAIYKDNKDKVGGHLLETYYPHHAVYLAKYLNEFRKKEISFAAISINNEPEAEVPWESCFYTIEEEANFARVLRDVLDDEGFSHTKFCIYDHNRCHLYNWVTTSFNDFETSSLFPVIAYHWYGGESEEIGKVHNLYPDKKIYFTEGCVELSTDETVGDYKHAVRYFTNYLHDINNGASLFLDWNILLDEAGGPNHVGNYCEAPIMYDTTKKKIIINPSYYAIKHFSPFVGSGYQRVITDFNLPNLDIAVLKNVVQNKLVVFIYNSGDKTSFHLDIDGLHIKGTLLSNSMNTLIINTKKKA